MTYLNQFRNSRMYIKHSYEQQELDKLGPSAELVVKPLPRQHVVEVAEAVGAAETVTRVAANADLPDDSRGAVEVEAAVVGVEEAVKTGRVVTTTEPTTSSPRPP
jgi:hypothetical protein